MTFFIVIGAVVALALLAAFAARQIAERKRRERREARDARHRQIELDWQARTTRETAGPSEQG